MYILASNSDAITDKFIPSSTFGTDKCFIDRNGDQYLILLFFRVYRVECGQN